MAIKIFDILDKHLEWHTPIDGDHKVWLETVMFTEEELQSILNKVFDEFNEIIWRLAIEEGGHQLHWNDRLNELKQKYLSKVEEKKE